VHVDTHAITPIAINGSGNHDQSVLSDKIPYASWLRMWERFKIEFEGLRGAREQQDTAGELK